MEKPCTHHGVGSVECQWLNERSMQASEDNLERCRQPRQYEQNIRKSLRLHKGDLYTAERWLVDQQDFKKATDALTC